VPFIENQGKVSVVRMQQTWSAEEIAEILGTSRRTIQHHIYLGRFGEVDKKGREYVLTRDNLVEYLGEARANELILHPAAFILSAHSKRGVPCSTWAAILAAKDLFTLVNATYWIDDLNDAGHGDPVGFSVDVVKFMAAREAAEDPTALDSDPLYDKTPAILRQIVKAAKV
jgi:hypothetical protein